MSKDLGSPGSRQLLQLQHFPKFFKILDPPFNFILPRSVWIPELCLSSVTILGFPELDLSSIVYHFRSLNDIKLPMLLTVELNIFYFLMVWFYRGRMFVKD